MLRFRTLGKGLLKTNSMVKINNSISNYKWIHK